MYQKIDKCPVCKSKEIVNLMICKDFLVSGESFAINECNSCTFRFTNPRPENSELNKYYQSEDYISHTSKANSLRHFIYKLVRKYTLRRKLKLINSLTRKGKILDVGCGSGEFLHVCMQDGWSVDGIEFDPQTRTKAEQLLNIRLFDQLSSCNNLNTYQVITFWHVLEHIPELNKTIRHIQKLLAPKGRIIIALPNVDSLDAQKYREFWAGYDVPRHLFHFNRTTFARLMKKHKLKVKSVLPMKLDAFYVSLLSESYKNSYFNYTKAFISGLKSNSYAKKHGNNYSSLIYIVKK